MNKTLASFSIAAGWFLVCGAPALAGSAVDYWPAWRGPHATGVADGNPPVTWSETENVKWKIDLPSSGDSTPVVWGDKIFLQTAVPTAEEPPSEGRMRPRQVNGRTVLTQAPTVPYRFNVLCIDRNTGETLWEKTAHESIPHEGFHPDHGYASFSPVTDGEHLWVSFGSQGLYCYDVDGNQKWRADTLQMLTFNGFGEGSSPALAGDVVVMVADHEGESKIFAFDKKTGEKRWERDRDEGTSWATPQVVEVNGKLQVITSGANFVRSYDAQTGEEIWRCAGLTRGVIPSPVIGFGKVFCMTGYQGPTLLAIDFTRTGDLTDTDAVAWTLDSNTPYVSSPLLYDDKIYFVQNLRPILSCYDAQTGKPHYEKEKLDELKQIYSSPVGAGGHVYLAGRSGVTYVMKHSDTFEVVAKNTLDDGIDSSPVVIGDELYIRSNNHLYCIAEQ